MQDPKRPEGSLRTAKVEQSATRTPSASDGTPGASDRGKTIISDEVVSVIARIAAEQVEGVHQIGESSLRGVFGKGGRHVGVESEVGSKEAAVEIDVVIAYGYPIHQVAQTIRDQIVERVEHMTGRRVVEVNVNVVDVYIPRMETKQKRRVE